MILCALGDLLFQSSGFWTEGRKGSKEGYALNAWKQVLNVALLPPKLLDAGGSAHNQINERAGPSREHNHQDPNEFVVPFRGFVGGTIHDQ